METRLEAGRSLEIERDHFRDEVVDAAAAPAPADAAAGALCCRESYWLSSSLGMTCCLAYVHLWAALAVSGECPVPCLAIEGYSE